MKSEKMFISEKRLLQNYIFSPELIWIEEKLNLAGFVLDFLTQWKLLGELE